MKQQIETIKRRVGAIRRNPDMTPTHAALAISEVADALESIDGRLAALEAAEKDRAQRKDWAVGAKVQA